MAADNDLIRGRKMILDALRMNNWESVLSYAKNHALPIKKVEGRWLARKSSLMEWHDRITGAKESESVQQCAYAHISTRSKEAHARKRGPQMSAFLAVYGEVFCCVAEACRQSGMKYRTFYAHRKNYPRFDSACRSIEEEVRGTQEVNYE